MKQLVAVLLLALALWPGVADAQSTELTQQDIDRITDSVVMIWAVADGQPISTGSGTIVTPTGLIYTNDHVVDGADEYWIGFVEEVGEAAQPRYYAALVERYAPYDLALLQINADADGNPLDPNTLNLPAIPLAQNDPALGERLYIFGFPGLGDGYLVMTVGNLTTIQNDTINGLRLPRWYQTDAEISPGNSGGLAVNARGEFIGIPTEVISEERTLGRLGGLLPVGTVAAVLGLDRAQPYVTARPEQPQAPGPSENNAPSPGGASGVLDWSLTPNYGGTQLAAGFLPDPFKIDLLSGGNVNVFAAGVGDGCVGFATAQPDYRLIWSGQSQGIRFVFVGEDGGDTALIVNDSTGAWHCNDDSYETLNPTVTLLDPPEGQYDIWVASYSEGQYIEGALYITERDSVTPLTPAGS